MPLIVKDFNWRQTESLITIQVPLRGVHQSKVDIFTSPKYIKASYEINFFEVFLLHDINHVTSKCTLTSSEIVFELEKCEGVLWDKLEIDISKSEKMILKRKLMDEEHQRFQNECKERHANKCELKRVAIQEQISLDTKQRNLIDKIRNEEKMVALGDLNKWQEHAPKNVQKIIELHSDDDDDDDDDEKEDTNIDKGTIPKPKVQIKPFVPKSKRIISRLPSEPMPLIRKTAKLEIDFTPRQFPTPCRESNLDEENEWLRKQAEVRRTVGFMSEDLRPEEKNPQYLKSKGQEFLKANNYLGAISAFGFGIKLTDQFPDLYIGRSEAHFKQGNFFKASQDCSSALDLLKPAVSSNLNERILCFKRRGMALCEMGYKKEGVSELEFALKLKPTDEEIRTILEDAKNQLNSLEDD